jgi:hypothetical protein
MLSGEGSQYTTATNKTGIGLEVQYTTATNKTGIGLEVVMLVSLMKIY